MTDRILIDTAALLTATFYADGVATDPDANTATVTVTSADGTAIVTAAGTTKVSTGVYSWSLAPRSSVDLLTLAWTGLFSANSTTVRTSAEIVGGYYASIAEIRNSDPSLSNTTDYPAAALDAARAEAEDEAERIMGRAFVRRYRRDTNIRADRFGMVTTRMPHVQTLRKVTARYFGDTWTVSTSDCRIIDDRTIWLPVFAGAMVTVDYEHGGLEDPPGEVVSKGILVRARQIAQRALSGIPESSDSVTMTEFGMIRHSRPTPGSTGQAMVDAVYQSYNLDFGIA